MNPHNRIRLLQLGSVIFLRLLESGDSYRYRQGYCLENAECAGENRNKMLGSNWFISFGSAIYNMPV